MRLIDADKLPYVSKVILVDDVDGDIVITIAKEYTSYVNDETPTVEAIPIGWFKQWEGYEQGMAIVNLKDIVEYWEKENEQTNRR